MIEMSGIEIIILSVCIIAIFLMYLGLAAQFQTLQSRYDNMSEQFKTLLEFHGEMAREYRELKLKGE